MCKISIIIPTYERPYLIHDILYNQIAKYTGNKYEILIHDSSNDYMTQQEYENYVSQAKELTNIKYFRHESTVSLPNKVKLAIQECKTTYFFIVGDGISLDYQGLESVLNDMNFSSYDVININSNRGHYCIKHRMTNKLIDYGYNSKQYVLDNMSLMTLYGASIVKKELFMEAIEKGYFDKFLKANEGLNGYVYVSSLCENILNHEDLRLISLYSGVVASNRIPKPHENKWMVGESLYRVGFGRFLNSINVFDNLDEDEKRYVCERYYKKDWAAFSLKNVLDMKEDQTVSFALINKYKEYLKIAGVYKTFVIGALFPTKIYHGIKSFKELLKRVLRTIKEDDV